MKLVWSIILLSVAIDGRAFGRTSPVIDRRGTLYSNILRKIAIVHDNHEKLGRGRSFISSISGSFASLHHYS